jgi:hypothetical protein
MYTIPYKRRLAYLYGSVYMKVGQFADRDALLSAMLDAADHGHRTRAKSSPAVPADVRAWPLSEMVWAC